MYNHIYHFKTQQADVISNLNVSIDRKHENTERFQKEIKFNLPHIYFYLC